MLARFHPNTIESIVLNKLKQTNDAKADVLLKFYRGDLALHIQNLQKAPLNIEQTELLAYQKKLSSIPVQNHRRKLMAAFDGLTFQSQWQAVLIRTIQDSIQLTLPKEKRKYYIISDEQSILEELADFNSVLNMYSLRYLPSEQLIEYLNTLNDSHSTLEIIDIAFRETLEEQKSIQISLQEN